MPSSNRIGFSAMAMRCTLAIKRMLLIGQSIIRQCQQKNDMKLSSFYGLAGHGLCRDHKLMALMTGNECASECFNDYIFHGPPRRISAPVASLMVMLELRPIWQMPGKLMPMLAEPPTTLR